MLSKQPLRRCVALPQDVIRRCWRGCFAWVFDLLERLPVGLADVPTFLMREFDDESHRYKAFQGGLHFGARTVSQGVVVGLYCDGRTPHHAEVISGELVLVPDAEFEVSQRGEAPS